MVMDGNRRWARQMGIEDAKVGHRYGAEHLDEVPDADVRLPAVAGRVLGAVLLRRLLARFPEVDFLRALRSYAARNRRFGG
jgi:undecaprenyl pyrophosphate synthase